MPQKPATLFLLLILLVCTGNRLLAQVTFTATIFPTTINRNETAELRLMFENANRADITLPPLTDFTVVGGPVQKSFPEIDDNGVFHSYAGFAYVLKPKKKGIFTIAATTAKLDGKTVRSNPVTVKVTEDAFSNALDETQQPADYNGFVLKKGENIQDKISRNIFIKVFTDKTSCYVGEPVLVTYKLYTRLNSRSKIIKRSAFNGFSVIDLKPEQWGSSSTKENINGHAYYVYMLRQAQLYPMQPGAAALEPVLVENYIRLLKGEYLKPSRDDGPPEVLPGVKKEDAVVDTTVITGSTPVSINVKPLPVAGKPPAFNGAVGNFMVDAVVEKNDLTTDDAGNIRILLSGEGNMTLLPAPEIAWPNGLEGYEPAVKDGLNRLSVPVSGSKIFDYSFTAAKEGNYTIPPVEFSFFDGAAGKYKTVNTKPVTVHIAKGTGKRLVIAADNRSRQESFAEKIFTHRWMIIVPVAVLIIAGLLLWLKTDKKREKEKRIAAALQQLQAAPVVEETLPSNPLEQSELVLVQNDPRKFYETIGKELHLFLAARLKIPVETISKKAIADGLDRLGVNITDSLAVQQLLDDIALQLYTPFADENKMQEYYVEAVRLVKNL